MYIYTVSFTELHRCVDGGNVLLDEIADFMVKDGQSRKNMHAIAVFERAFDVIRHLGFQHTEMILPPAARFQCDQDVGLMLPDKSEQSICVAVFLEYVGGEYA